MGVRSWTTLWDCRFAQQSLHPHHSKDSKIQRFTSIPNAKYIYATPEFLKISTHYKVINPSPKSHLNIICLKVPISPSKSSNFSIVETWVKLTLSNSSPQSVGLPVKPKNKNCLLPKHNAETGMG